jgi:hypothetical protein
MARRAQIGRDQIRQLLDGMNVSLDTALPTYPYNYWLPNYHQLAR